MSSAGLSEQQGFGGGGQRSGRGAGDDQGDAGRLVEFLKTLDGDLQKMIADQGFLDDNLRALATRAYEAGATPQIDEMIRLLTDEWGSHLEALTHHGVTGVQLDFKLRVHGMAREAWLSPAPPGPVIVIIPGAPGQIGADEPSLADIAARDYLNCSDIILESLSGALGGAGAAVVEIKKMIEWLKGAGWRWMRRMVDVR